jgi:hypothetical protein
MDCLHQQVGAVFWEGSSGVEPTWRVQEREFFSSLDQLLNMQCDKITRTVDAVTTGVLSKENTILGKRERESSPGYSSHAKKRKENMTETQKNILNEWFAENIDDPYPSEEVKNELALRTALDRRKIDNFFVNTRRRKFSTDGRSIPLRPQLREKLAFQKKLAQKLSLTSCQCTIIGNCIACRSVWVGCNQNNE